MQRAGRGMLPRVRPFLLLLILGHLGVAAEPALPVPAQRAETAYVAALAKLSAARKAELDKLTAVFEREFEAAQKRHDESAASALRQRIAALVAIEDPFEAPGAPAAARPGAATSQRAGGLVITRARYGVGETWADVTDFVREQMVQGELRHFDPMTIFEVGRIDPAPQLMKYLELEYTWNGRPDRLRAPEHAFFSLPPAAAPEADPTRP